MSSVGCGNTNPEVRCRQMVCDDCRKLNDAIRNGEGYQPKNKLDISKQPQEGSVVPTANQIIKLENFLCWFKDFAANVGVHPTVNEWILIKMKIRELRE